MYLPWYCITSLLGLSFRVIDLWLNVVLFVPLRAWRCLHWKRTRPKVVIVGGSFAGLTALRELGDEFDVTLVDTKTYFEYVPGVLRCFVDHTYFRQVARPLTAAVSSLGWFVQGTATDITDDDHVVVRLPGDDQTAAVRLPFDYCLLATGMTFRDPISKATALWSPTGAAADFQGRLESYRAEAARVASAKSVLVLGGGAVGTELAAEIAETYPACEVTIVDMCPKLLALFPSSTSRYAEAWFKRRPNCELVLGTPIASWDDTGCVMWGTGREIKADVVYVCFGVAANSDAATGRFAQALMPRGRAIRVNDHLQVAQADGSAVDAPALARNIFVAGDVMHHGEKGEMKQAFFAETSAAVAANNIRRKHQGRQLATYPDAWFPGARAATKDKKVELPLVYVVSLGCHDGSLGFNSLVINGTLAAVVKWVLEWTKVKQMVNSHIGKAIWILGDTVTGFLSPFIPHYTPEEAAGVDKKKTTTMGQEKKEA